MRNYENIRKIPVNLTCGDLMDMRDNLIEAISCYRDISVTERRGIQGLIFSTFEYKIFKAVDTHLSTGNSHLKNTTNNLWSSSPNIPTIIHNANEFGHTPKRNSTPKKTKHPLSSTAKENIRALNNLSRIFCEWVKQGKNSLSLYDGHFYYEGASMKLRLNQNEGRVYLDFYGPYSVSTTGKYCVSMTEKHSFPVNTVLYRTNFWSTYSRRVTKTIAKIIRDIENNPDNWVD